MGEDNMDCLSIQDISNKWNISKRRIQILCREGRINGAKMIGNMWVVPKDPSSIYKQIYNDISEKSMDYAIDDVMVGMASDFISKHENDAEIDSIVSWAYQYSNKLVVCSDYSQTHFFTEKYMINYLVRNIKELVNADKVLDPCSGGNFLVECLELLCEFFNEGDVQKYIIDQTQKLYGYDIDNVIARIAVVNIRIKAISIIKKRSGSVI